MKSTQLGSARWQTLGLVALGAVLLACGGDETRSIRPQLVAPGLTQDFGAVPVLNEKVLDIPLLNVGKADLRVTSVRLKEEDVPFRIATSPEAVGSGETLPIQVAFTPPVEADFAATLVLETDDPDEPVVEVNLVGKGSTRAVMVIEPTMVDFGRVAEGTAAVQTVVIRSEGTADLIVEEIAFVEGSSAAFGFLGSVNTPAVVPHTRENGLHGEIRVTVRYTVEEGAPDVNTATLRVRGTDPDQREVLIPIIGTVNRAPTAVIEPMGVGSPGLEVTLDGSMSSDPDNDVPLTYKWVLRSKPLGAQTTIAGPEQPVTKMTLDPTLPGEYVVELTVTDALGAKNLTATRASVVAAPAQKLLIEMFWDNTKTDIDLHMLRTRSTVVGSLPDDCFYQNKAPDWGVTGDDTDDPSFLKDALVGFGPEVIGYVNPIDNTYRIVAEFKNDNNQPNPVSAVTVRIYQYGVVKFEQKKVLSAEGAVWGVADIEWPSGAITVLEP